MFLFRGKNSTIKKLLFTKLFLEEPEPKEFLYCESDASPEIPGIYYKKQAPVHDTPFVDNLFPTNEESITFFDQRFQSKITENNYKIPDGNKKWLIPHEMNKKKKEEVEIDDREEIPHYRSIEDDYHAIFHCDIHGDWVDKDFPMLY